MGVMMSVLMSGLLYGADIADGQRIYRANCQACHGERADGKGVAAAALDPAPTDFTKPEYWMNKTDRMVASAIRVGSPGTSMMGFSNLSSEEIDDLVAFLRTRKE